MVAGAAFSQGPVEPRPTPDTSLIPDYRMAQHEAWSEFNESFPAKERSMWQIGVNAGMIRATSDVRSDMGYGAGATVRKGLGSTLSLRLQYTHGYAFGQDWTPSNAVKNNAGINGTIDPDVDYFDEFNQSGLVFHNFRTEFDEISLEGLWSLKNILFHKRKPMFSPYLAVGVGLTMFETRINQLDELAQTYDYTTVGQSTDVGQRENQLNQLQTLRDNTYESKAAVDGSTYGHNDRSLEPNLSFGAGLGFRLGRKWELTLEHRIILMRNDLFDGQQWQEPITPSANSTLSQNNDFYHYTALGLGFNFAKNHQEVDWYMNPLTYVYDEINYLEKKTDFRDDDDDGVPNAWDREPDSPAGAVVNPRGETMDSDGDGCPDHEDEEPFSTPQYEIVDCKNVIPEIAKSELAGTTGLSEQEVIDRLTDLILGGSGMGDWFLPTIHFALDKSKIRPDDYHRLKQVADLMTKYPDLSVDVIGHTDVRASDDYNDKLSTRRAEAAVDHISTKYGIDAGRFNMKFMGEGDNLIENARSEAEHQANRRVEFQVASEDNP